MWRRKRIGFLNFKVDNIDQAVDELTNRGVQFEHYEDSPKLTRRVSYATGSRIWVLWLGLKTRPGIF
jgi:hypothetical protein